MLNLNEKKLPVIFRYRLLWHTLFWLVIYFGYVISYGGYGQGKFEHEAIINAILLPVKMIFTYLLVYFITPVFLIKRKYTSFCIAVAIHAFIFGFVIWMALKFAIYIKGYACYDEYPIFAWNKILVSAISNYAVPLAAMLLKLFKLWYKDQVFKNQLQHEKITSELKYLKAQIHPHFLFNTLNNLYALTLRNSGEAADVVLKLSSMLDYMLYYSNNEIVSVDKEIKILEDYIELEKIRYGDRLKLSYNVKGDRSSMEIAPLILFPFVENAFKHGASKDRTSPEIDISIVIDKQCICLRIRNSIPKEKLVDTRKNTSNGLGIKNIKRQLELSYPNHHNLNVTVSDKYYHIDLKIFGEECTCQ